MSIFGKLFGTEGTTTKLMDMADELWETTEEKSKTKMMFLKLYEPFKLAQRILMFTFCVPFVAINTLCAGIWIYCIMFATNGELYDFRVEQLKQGIESNFNAMGDPVAWIVAFYFLGGAGEGMIKAWLTRYKK